MSVSYCQPLDKTSGRHSSSTFIAHLMHQEYPPKVQPRSSAARDNGLILDMATQPPKAPVIDYSLLDKVDAEAGCILIALANHDPAKAPFSIPVADAAAALLQAAKSTGDRTQPKGSALARNTTDSIISTSSSSSSTSGSSNSMSISSLLSNDAPPSPALTSQQEEPLDQKPIEPLSTDKIPRSLFHNAQSGDEPWNSHIPSDPIMLLVAAAEAVTSNDKAMAEKDRRRSGGKLYGDFFNLSRERDEDVDRHVGQPKRKWHDRSMSDAQDSNDSRQRLSPEKRPRQSHDTWQEDIYEERNPRSSDNNSFSWQYQSMKQNPKIKRNAMHAYITYMIYTDMVDEQSVSYYFTCEYNGNAE
ncbi:hypothetical protein CLU79DRAFT_742751 [Phycomyces nitens]|nr:hypothetical protein CLU79DRAFT_742751 [Phycomyces nitens]